MAKDERIFHKGKVITARRKDIIKIVLGPLGELKEVKGVIEFDEDGVILYTRESPACGTHYPKNYIGIVRIIGIEPIIKNGRYDIFALSPDEAKNRIFGVEISIDPLMTLKQARELAPILSATKEAHGYQKFLHKRKVIIITPEMDVNFCYENDNEKPTPINIGDAFVITDSENQKGYRISKSEFYDTHTLC